MNFRHDSGEAVHLDIFYILCNHIYQEIYTFRFWSKILIWQKRAI